MGEISLLERTNLGDANITKDYLFNFDYLFDMLKNNNISEFGIAKRNYVDLKLLSFNYANLLNTLYAKEIDEIIKSVSIPSRKLFQKHIYLSKSHYELIWDVRKLIKIANKKNTIRTISNNEIKNLACTVDIYALDNKRVQDAIKDKIPPIVAYMPCMNPAYFILDGNHRIYTNAVHNTHHMDIYELQCKDFTKALISDLYKSLYYIHNNLNYIIQYMLGEITNNQLNKMIHPLINNLY